MPKSRAQYTGILATPFDPFKERDAEKAFNKRIKALFDWFGIETAAPDRYKRLAIALAFEAHLSSPPADDSLVRLGVYHESGRAGRQNFTKSD